MRCIYIYVHIFFYEHIYIYIYATYIYIYICVDVAVYAIHLASYQLWSTFVVSPKDMDPTSFMDPIQKLCIIL